MKIICLTAVLCFMWTRATLAGMEEVSIPQTTSTPEAPIRSPEPPHPASPKASRLWRPLPRRGEEIKSEPFRDRFSVLSGAFLIYSGNINPYVSGALAVRAKASSDWSFELGGSPPQDAPDQFFRTSAKETFPTVDTARIDRMSEVHLTVHYVLPAGGRVKEKWFEPEAVFGVSVLEITNAVTQKGEASGPVTDIRSRRLSSSPVVGLGLRLFPKALLSIRLDVLYASYPDAFSAFDRSFDMSLSGLTVRPMVEVRL